jgi:resuscitation-promoting factor RpfB
MQRFLLTPEPRQSVLSRLSGPLRRYIDSNRMAVPILTFCVLLVVTIVGYVAFTRDTVRATDGLVVIINHDDVEQTVPTAPTTVGELLKKLDIPVGEGDVVEPAQNTNIRQDDFRINVYRSKPVEVIDNGRRTLAFSAAATPRSVAKQAGAVLYPEDELKTEPVTEFLKDRTLGAKIIVDRATPVTMNLYGKPVEIRTQAETVEELLKERNIKLSKDDSVTPVASTKLAAQSQVFLLRQGTKITSVTEEIPMPVENIHDQNLAIGTSAVRQAGSPGQKVVTYQLNLQNGQEVGRTVIQEVVAKTPVKQIVVQGASLSGIKGNMGLAGIAPGDYQYVDYIVSKESRWNPLAQNASGAYGLCQALPGSKMASAGADWQTNPVTQLKWCHGYAVGKYGSWAAAYNFWVRNHWW